MNLVLRCIALNDQTMSQPLIGRFDERGGTLGRSDDATLTLPDPERRISRLQAQVLHREDQYWIENVSNISPVLHNGHPVGQGMQVALRDGDELRISDYLLQVAFEDGLESDTILRGRNVPPNLGSAADPKAPPMAIPHAGPGDLSLQQGALTAGMRAVLETALDRLDPEKLDATLGRHTFFKRLWPMGRAIHLWKLYLGEYNALRGETQADFQRSFGQIFRAAYEAHLRRPHAGPDETVRPDEAVRRIAERIASAPPK